MKPLRLLTNDGNNATEIARQRMRHLKGPEGPPGSLKIFDAPDMRRAAAAKPSEKERAAAQRVATRVLAVTLLSKGPPSALK